MEDSLGRAIQIGEDETQACLDWEVGVFRNGGGRGVGGGGRGEGRGGEVRGGEGRGDQRSDEQDHGGGGGTIHTEGNREPWKIQAEEDVASAPLFQHPW